MIFLDNTAIAPNESAVDCAGAGRKRSLGRYSDTGIFGRDISKARILEETVEKFVASVLASPGRRIVHGTPENGKCEKRWDVLFSVEENGVKKSFAVEVKDDDKSFETGNMAVEIACRGVPSGILSTRSNIHVFRVPAADGVTPALLFLDTKKLRAAVLCGGASGEFKRRLSKRDPERQAVNILVPLERARKLAFAEFPAGSVGKNNGNVEQLRKFIDSIPLTSSGSDSNVPDFLVPR